MFEKEDQSKLEVVEQPEIQDRLGLYHGYMLVSSTVTEPVLSCTVVRTVLTTIVISMTFRRQSMLSHIKTLCRNLVYPYSSSEYSCRQLYRLL